MGRREEGCAVRVRGVPALACLIIMPAAKFTEFWPLGSGSLNK